MNIIKEKYYKIAKKKEATIEEIDCYIEEYKNYKIEFSMPGTMIATITSMSIVAITSLFSIQANIQGMMYSKLFDVAVKDSSVKIDNFGDFGISEILNLILNGITIAAAIIIIGILFCFFYNQYNKNRLSGFYEYKRELLHKK